MLDTLTGVQTPDEALVRRTRAGDTAAREALFERHRNESYRYAYRLLGNEQDALDVVQEAMLKAFSAIGEFDGRSGFRTWLLADRHQYSLRLGPETEATVACSGRRCG